MRDTPGVLLATQRQGLGTVPMPYSRNYSTTLKQSGNLLYKTPPIDPRIAAQRGVFGLSTSPLSRAQCKPSELGLPIPSPYWLRDPAERLTTICDTQKWAKGQVYSGRPS